MGRHFERSDAGYVAYSGFIHMEASKRIFVLTSFILKKNFDNKVVF